MYVGDLQCNIRPHNGYVAQMRHRPQSGTGGDKGETRGSIKPPTMPAAPAPPYRREPMLLCRAVVINFVDGV
jgi:hypothetical protein